jgi:hypothetical protein
LSDATYSFLLDTLKKSANIISEPYLTSFCGVANSVISESGLLSQWRGYGIDGGYAIVFDTKALKALVAQEKESS